MSDMHRINFNLGNTFSIEISEPYYVCACVGVAQLLQYLSRYTLKLLSSFDSQNKPFISLTKKFKVY